MSWQVIVDFDGTITSEDTTDQLLERFAHPQWLEIEAEWEADRIGSRECMTRQVDLLRATPAELDSFVERVGIDWHFLSFVRVCRRNGVPITVVSDGFDRVIHRVLHRVGAEGLPVVANQLAWMGGERWRLTSPHSTADCRFQSGTCKCAVASRRTGFLTLVVGDGRSDRCVAEGADFVFAKKGLAAFCRERGLAYQSFADFAAATELLKRLVGITARTFGPHSVLEGISNG